jgi:hypothetical protein
MLESVRIYFFQNCEAVNMVNLAAPIALFMNGVYIARSEYLHAGDPTPPGLH